MRRRCCACLCLAATSACRLAARRGAVSPATPAGMIITSALMIWKSLVLGTGSESPVRHAAAATLRRAWPLLTALMHRCKPCCSPAPCPPTGGGGAERQHGARVLPWRHPVPVPAAAPCRDGRHQCVLGADEGRAVCWAVACCCAWGMGPSRAAQRRGGEWRVCKRSSGRAAQRCHHPRRRPLYSRVQHRWAGDPHCAPHHQGAPAGGQCQPH